MKAIIFDIKASKSGKHDVLTLQGSVAKQTAFGTALATRFYNILLESGSCTLPIGSEIEIDLNDYTLETSQLDNNICYWLKPNA